MLRLDKYLCEMKVGSRSQIKVLLKQGLVTVNGETVKQPEQKIDEKSDTVLYKGRELRYQKFVYFMLNKPAGVVSATRDNTCGTVTALLKATGHRDLFPVGRLDKDTEGLLLLTNDGELAHNLLSPKKHVSKVYYAELKKELTGEDIKKLEAGVDIGEDKLTLPAGVELLMDRRVYLTITEGKFHQAKRMFQAVGNQVLYLKRMAMGSLKLDPSLAPGEYRELTEGEVRALQERKR